MKTLLQLTAILLFSNYSFSQCNFIFTDIGGVSGNYTPNSTYIYTICPLDINTFVNVTFTEFNTEAEHDGMYVFNGPSIAGPQIASTNPAGFVPGGLAGAFWGNTIPGPFTSTTPDGCLTFWFRSDDTNQNSGWVAYVDSCAPLESGFNLNAFLDLNSNGIQDSGENNFPLGEFHYVKNGTFSNYLYNYNGNSLLYENNPANTYDFDFIIDSDYSASFGTNVPSFSNISIGTSPNVVDLNFPITTLISYNDLAVNYTPLSQPTAGFNYTNRLSYTNYGSTLIDGSLTFIKDNALSIVSTTVPVNSNPTGFTYDFTNLLPFETRTIDVTMSVPSIPTVSIGQLVTNSVSISTPLTELTTTNNSSSSTHIIFASYDPNDITESHGEKIVYPTFDPDEYLNYTIRFENTGTTYAQDISITDLLDSQIDETSIHMISASHQYTLTRVDNNLTWNFNNIYLPVSVANTNTGKGFLTFKAKLKPGFALGDVIPNKANIYFDTNPAIETNTFNTEFVATLSNSNFISNSDITIAPNPAKNKLYLYSNQNSKINEVRIYNVLGQLVSNYVNPSNEIDVAGLKAGNYFINIVTDKGALNSKFIKE
jgi:uncharacterized repeat protein (TIGR01451 family)